MQLDGGKRPEQEPQRNARPRDLAIADAGDGAEHAGARQPGAKAQQQAAGKRPPASRRRWRKRDRANAKLHHGEHGGSRKAGLEHGKQAPGGAAMDDLVHGGNKAGGAALDGSAHQRCKQGSDKERQKVHVRPRSGASGVKRSRHDRRCGESAGA